LVRFYLKIWSYSLSNKCSVKQILPERRRVATSRTPRAPRCPPRHPRLRPRFPRQPVSPGRAFPHAPMPRGSLKSSRPRANHGPCRTGRCAHRGPPVRRRHAAVRVPVEVAVLRRHLHRSLPSPSVEPPYKCLALFPPPTAIAPQLHHPRRHRRAAPLPASHGQASTHIPSIDPLEPSSATCCSGQARVVAGATPPRPPPLVSVVRPRRRDLRPNTGHPQALGERTDVPRRFPGRERARFAGIWPVPPPPMAKGRISSRHLVLGCFP
jgi:hypothetical protein